MGPTLMEQFLEFIMKWVRLLLETVKTAAATAAASAIRLKIKQEKTMQTAFLNEGKKLPLSVEAFNVDGVVAPIDGKFEWTANNEGFVGLFPSTDGKTCDVTFLAAAPSTIITVTAKSMSGAILTEMIDVQTTATAPAIKHADHLVVTIGQESQLASL